jgi:hypothetical protein
VSSRPCWKFLYTRAHLGGKDEWLLIGSQGYLATSTPAAVQWRVTSLTITGDKLLSVYHNAEMLQKTLAREKIDPPALTP